MRLDRLKIAPIHLRAALKEDQIALRILSAFRNAAKSVGAS
jgi:hypothetical protein